MSTELITKTGDAVLIAGGYGVVGRQAAQLIRRRHPSLPLIIAGRNPAPADSLARELTHAGVTQLDVLRPNPLNRLRPRAIVAAVNDPHDYLLMDAVQNGIPYLDITRWTERLRSTVSHLSARPLMTAVMLSSGWMAGIASVMAAAASRRLNRTDSIDLSILYSLRDKAGPNSVEYLDRLATPFEVMLNGERTQVHPFTDPRKITFPVGRRATAYRFDTPDQYTLPVATGAKTVSARIAFDDAVTSGLLVFLIRSGIWKLYMTP